jgi:6-phosphogluconolactonase
VSEFKVYPDGDSLARTAAEHFVTLAAEAINARGWFIVALSGGLTPRAAYSLLASDEFAARVDWSHVYVFWSDERCVPPDHPDSNYRMAREAWLDKVPILADNIHRIRGELDPHQAAADYRAELETVLGAAGQFDLILLGLGADGHTASLFPATTALEERERSVVAVYVEQLQTWRVTLTLTVINAARHVLFLVSGTAKAETLARVCTGEPLPAGLVQPTQGQLIWLVDQNAASDRKDEEKMEILNGYPRWR